MYKQTPAQPFTGLLLAVMVICCISTPKSRNLDDHDGQVVSSWNQKIMDMATAEDGLLTLKGVRTEALAHTAIHDAINSIKPIYKHYSFHQETPNADPIAAAAQAAYQIVVSQYPDHKEVLMTELERWLSGVEDGDDKTKGIELGKASAAHLLEMRADDQWNAEADYLWHPMAPGVYAEFNEHSGTPEGFVFGAGWAVAKPFLLSSQDQFRSPPPPEIKSQEYTRAFNEVKEVGAHESAARSKDQSHMAMWWKDFVESSHNRLARNLVVKENLNLWETARVFALMNMSIFDAYINVFENKFHYNHWRPYTAIHWAANDGNDQTQADTNWNNLHEHTYAFPSYPSAHGTASTAAMTTLANTLGTGDHYTFTMTTREVDRAGPFSDKISMEPPTRSFERFSEAGFEASISRVYLGIHFRYDSEQGYELGKKIGDFANQHYLQPLETN